MWLFLDRELLGYGMIGEGAEGIFTIKSGLDRFQSSRPFPNSNVGQANFAHETRKSCNSRRHHGPGRWIAREMFIVCKETGSFNV